MHLVNRT